MENFNLSRNISKREIKITEGNKKSENIRKEYAGIENFSLFLKDFITNSSIREIKDNESEYFGKIEKLYQGARTALKDIGTFLGMYQGPIIENIKDEKVKELRTYADNLIKLRDDLEVKAGKLIDFEATFVTEWHKGDTLRARYQTVTSRLEEMKSTIDKSYLSDTEKTYCQKKVNDSIKEARDHYRAIKEPAIYAKRYIPNKNLIEDKDLNKLQETIEIKTGILIEDPMFDKQQDEVRESYRKIMGEIDEIKAWVNKSELSGEDKAARLNEITKVVKKVHNQYQGVKKLDESQQKARKRLIARKDMDELWKGVKTKNRNGVRSSHTEPVESDKLPKSGANPDWKPGTYEGDIQNWEDYTAEVKYRHFQEKLESIAVTAEILCEEGKMDKEDYDYLLQELIKDQKEGAEKAYEAAHTRSNNKEGVEGTQERKEAVQQLDKHILELTYYQDFMELRWNDRSIKTAEEKYGHIKKDLKNFEALLEISHKKNDMGEEKYDQLLTQLNELNEGTEKAYQLYQPGDTKEKAYQRYQPDNIEKGPEGAQERINAVMELDKYMSELEVLKGDPMLQIETKSKDAGTQTQLETHKNDIARKYKWIYKELRILKFNVAMFFYQNRNGSETLKNGEAMTKEQKEDLDKKILELYTNAYKADKLVHESDDYHLPDNWRQSLKASKEKMLGIIKKDRRVQSDEEQLTNLKETLQGLGIPVDDINNDEKRLKEYKDALDVFNLKEGIKLLNQKIKHYKDINTKGENKIQVLETKKNDLEVKNITTQESIKKLFEDLGLDQFGNPVQKYNNQTDTEEDKSNITHSLSDTNTKRPIEEQRQEDGELIKNEDDSSVISGVTAKKFVEEQSKVDGELIKKRIQKQFFTIKKYWKTFGQAVDDMSKRYLEDGTEDYKLILQERAKLGKILDNIAKKIEYLSYDSKERQYNNAFADFKKEISVSFDDMLNRIKSSQNIIERQKIWIQYYDHNLWRKWKKLKNSVNVALGKKSAEVAKKLSFVEPNPADLTRPIPMLTPEDWAKLEAMHQSQTDSSKVVVESPSHLEKTSLETTMKAPLESSTEIALQEVAQNDALQDLRALFEKHKKNIELRQNAFYESFNPKEGRTWKNHFNNWQNKATELVQELEKCYKQMENNFHHDAERHRASLKAFKEEIGKGIEIMKHGTDDEKRSKILNDELPTYTKTLMKEQKKFNNRLKKFDQSISVAEAQRPIEKQGQGDGENPKEKIVAPFATIEKGSEDEKSSEVTKEIRQQFITMKYQWNKSITTLNNCIMLRLQNRTAQISEKDHTDAMTARAELAQTIGKILKQIASDQRYKPEYHSHLLALQAKATEQVGRSKQAWSKHMPSIYTAWKDLRTTFTDLGMEPSAADQKTSSQSRDKLERRHIPKFIEDLAKSPPSSQEKASLKSTLEKKAQGDRDVPTHSRVTDRNIILKHSEVLKLYEDLKLMEQNQPSRNIDDDMEEFTRNIYNITKDLKKIEDRSVKKILEGEECKKLLGIIKNAREKFINTEPNLSDLREEIFSDYTTLWNEINPPSPETASDLLNKTKDIKQSDTEKTISELLVKEAKTDINKWQVEAPFKQKLDDKTVKDLLNKLKSNISQYESSIENKGNKNRDDDDAQRLKLVEIKSAYGDLYQILEGKPLPETTP